MCSFHFVDISVMQPPVKRKALPAPYIITNEDMTNFLTIISFSRFWSGTHFVWNHKRQKLQVTKSLWKLFKFAFVLYGWLVYFGFLLEVIFYFGWFRGNPLQEYQRAILLLSGGLVPSIVLLVMVVHERDICVLINSCLRLGRLCEGIYNNLLFFAIFCSVEKYVSYMYIHLYSDFLAKYGPVKAVPITVTGVPKRISKTLGMLLNGVKFYGITCGVLSLIKPDLNFFFTGTYLVFC